MTLPRFALTALLAAGLALTVASCDGAAAPPAASAFDPSVTSAPPAGSALIATPTALAQLLAATPTVAKASPDITREPTANEVVQRTQLTIPDLVEHVRPSVVHIVTEVATPDASGQPTPGGGVGTGFIISAEGHIVTNNHVVEGADRIVVTYPTGGMASGTQSTPNSGRRHPRQAADAEIVGRDPQTDLAVLRIDVDGLTPLPLGASSDLRAGQTVVAIGHALDLPGGPTVTAGVVSALGRVLTGIGPQRLTLSDLIQTDASINPGNSGGPLLNLYGEVVGVNSAGAGAAEGIGFAIAIDNAKLVIDALIKDGVVSRGFMGIRSSTITPAIARQFGLPVSQGLFIQAITVGAGAERAGLQAGDIIVGINDDPVGDIGELGRILAKYGPGTTVTVWYLRTDAGDEPQRTEVMLGVQPDR